MKYELILAKTISEINKEYDGIYDIHLELSDGEILIVDYYEELYYEGCNFDSVFGRLESAIKQVFGDDAYLECECPGRWVLVL